MDNDLTQTVWQSSRSSKAPVADIKRDLHRNSDGHEVWRIYETHRDGSFLIFHEEAASDHDAAWLMDTARHSDEAAATWQGSAGTRYSQRTLCALDRAD